MLSDYKLIETANKKILSSENINYLFNKRTGFSAVWGKTLQDDPDFSPFGPFIADIEITTICHGPGGKPCGFCYKSNNAHSGDYMTFDTFKQVFDKMPDVLQQIAFGVDAQCETNPDVWKIMDYCNKNGVMPNVTVADISDDVADKLVSLCGAVAVSRYDDKDICYDSVKKLTDRGLKQTNMHIMISEETFTQTIETITDIKKDERLSNLNAVVFLSLKEKGRGVGYTRLSTSKFRMLVDLCLESDVPFGFDSCSAVKFLESVKDHERFEDFETLSEPCESSRFSAYINVYGEYSPCSFLEGTDNTDVVPMSVLGCDDFVNDIWNSDRNKVIRDRCLKCLEKGVACQYYDI